MLKTTILAVVICALLVGLVPSANADAWIRWKDQNVQNYMEVVAVENADPWSLEGYVWQFGNSFDTPGFLLDDGSVDFRNCAYPQRLRVVGGGTGDWAQGDPSIPIYVRLITKFKNTGTDGWIDFHLRAISGCEIYAKYVMDNGLWTRFWDPTFNPEGWDYIMNPVDAMYGAEYGPVKPGEFFTCETWITVTSPTGDFEVELWPTIPEPSAFMGLGLGLTGLVGHILRRRSVR